MTVATLPDASTTDLEGRKNSPQSDQARSIIDYGGESSAVRNLVHFKAGEAATDRMKVLINEYIQEKGGAVLGGKSLWRAVRAAWTSDASFSSEPNQRDFQKCLNIMLKQKAIKEHWHAFRDHKGLFVKCQLILRPEVDAFSEKSLILVDKAKNAAIASDAGLRKEMSRSNSTQSNKNRVRGRRSLPEEVALLDAPVYAAQLAAKRVLETRNDQLHRLKRLRSSGQSLNSLQPQNATFALEISSSDKAYAGSVYQHGSNPIIRFLEPNTFLDNEPYDNQSGTVPRLSGQQQQELEKLDERKLSSAQTHGNSFAFDSIEPILRTSAGTWPHFDSQEDFDQLGTSLTLSGWTPSERWHKWAKFSEEIDTRLQVRLAKRLIAELRNTTPHPEPSPEELFITKLQACVDVESTWRMDFIDAVPGEAGPHVLFINIVSPTMEGAFTASPDLVWSPERRHAASSGNGVSSIPLGDATPTYERLDTRHCDSKAVSSLRTRAMRMILGRSTQKRVPLMTRRLTALPTQDETLAERRSEMQSEDELLAAFIVVRTLLGGVHKAVDWGLLMTIYPKLGLAGLRRFWADARKQQAAYISLFTRVFQERLIAALESDEISMVDFENPMSYEWGKLIKWAMQLPRQEGFELPGSRESLNKQYSLEDVKLVDEDWREKFFNSGSSFVARLEAISSEPGAIVMGEPPECVHPPSYVDDLVVARSWVRALLSSVPKSHLIQDVRSKFLHISPDDGQRRSELFKTAVSQLTQQRVIRRSKKPRAGEQPYRLSEWYVSHLARLAQSAKYDAAAIFKGELDATFRKKETFKVPYTISDGAMMALTNMNAAGRVRLVPVGMPDIPYGFEPGNYESRKYPKSHYHFSLEVEPTETYQYNDDIEVLRAAERESPPLEGSRGELPQWADFLGESNLQRWSEMLGAFNFSFAIRGSLTISAVCSALSPLLEEFEARLLLDWCKRTGVMTDLMYGLGTTLAEWWWLVVPWLRRQREYTQRQT
ncbi:hypothetical protein CP533_0423 [Ophiocordyceps camponoti-saundersi (nom. inval.)]|nr:hypothetical protein CP533_0423 [Ophiocordyceps camponoti-saundersi (nom. inval.)]